MVVEHEPRLSADLDPAHDARQATLVGLRVAHVLLKDEPLQIVDVVRRVLLAGDQIQVCTDDDDRRIGSSSLEKEEGSQA